MAHYAFIDDNNIVVEVIVGKDENEDGINWESKYAQIRSMKCKRYSYNTRGGIHYDPITKQPSENQSKAFRKNAAAIGYSYNDIRDAFIPPKPYSSFIFNEDTCTWEAPIQLPDDVGQGDPPKVYFWDEIMKNWRAMN